MANGDQVQGGGGGQRTYSEEDVMALMNEAARRAATEAVKNTQKKDEDEGDISVINPKVVKQLKDTVAVFTALKELSSNPLQKTIEETVGGMAASVVQSAFAPRGPPPKQDIVDKLLNSQFAFGLGSGMGQRAPELVETMGRTFGTDKAGQMMDNIIGKYGSGGGQSGPSRQLSPGPSPGPSSGHSGTQSPPFAPEHAPEQKTDKQSEKELLLSLDPNNPEHVSAYAETQGGLPVDVARKMLMIHQDAFIEQLKRDGMNVDQVSTQRGSRAQTSPPVQQPSGSRREPTDGEPREHTPTQQTPPAQPVPASSMRQDIPPTYPGSYPGSPIEPPSSQSPDNIEYAEYHDMTQPSQGPGSNQQPGGKPVPPGSVDGQQVEMMKTFAADIGKVMGDMLNKIESINNTVFTLQSEMNDMKRPGPKQPSSIHTDSRREPTGGAGLLATEMPPRIPSNVYPPGMTDAPMARTPSSISPPIITRRSTPVKAPSLETFEDQVIDTPKEELDIERSGDFFEENVIDISNFKQELEEEAKLSVTNSNMLSKDSNMLSTNSKVLSQKTQLHTASPGLVQPIIQPVPAAQPVPPVPVAQPVPSTVVQPALPTAQITRPVQVHQPPVSQQQIVQHTEKENKDDKDNIGFPKNENIVDIPETESEELNKIHIIPDSKTSEEKNDNNFVTPTNEQLKLSKKVGIHKKAAYRNIKPSFKKSDDEENKEENNI